MAGGLRLLLACMTQVGLERGWQVPGVRSQTRHGSAPQGRAWAARGAAGEERRGTPLSPASTPPSSSQDAAIEQCIREYEGIAVWTVTRDATTGAIASVRFPDEDIALAL